MTDEPRRAERSAEKTQAIIIRIAQQLFAEKGYSHAGLREIARRSNVAVSLIIKHFGSKAELFSQALTSALIEPTVFQSDRACFGQKVIDSVNDPDEPMLAPTMIALSLGDAEAREIIERVARDNILGPMTDWLGDPAQAARAKAIFMLTTGYAILSRPMAGEDTAETARILARLVQTIVDNDDIS